MATFQRLIFALLLLISGIAQADYPAVSTWGSQRILDGLEACKHDVGQTHPWLVVIAFEKINNSAGWCKTTSTGTPQVGLVGQYGCPYGGSLNVNQCVNPPPCPEGQVRQESGACHTPPVLCQAGRVLLSGPFADTDGDGSIPASSCISGCRANLRGGGAPQVSCNLGGAGTIGVCDYVYPGDYVDTGSNCTDPETTPPKNPPADKPPCPACDCMEKGGSFGQVQGVDVCLPKGTPGTLPVQTKPPPKVTETKPPATPENPDPDPERTVEPQPTVTVIPNPGGGEPTVKQETTNPDGSTTTTTSTMGEYCKDNATSSTCKSTGTGNGGSGGGDFRGNCEIGFTCSGDGVQCAIARKIHEQRCEDLKGMEPFATVADAGGKVLRGETPQDVTDFLAREGQSTKNINVGNLVKETGDFNFAAGCIADVSFSIGGHSISVPLSDVCPYFEMIGYFLLAAAYLAALRIVEII